MHRLSLLILGFSLSFALWAQNPHGESLKIDCFNCHTTEGWKSLLEPLMFNHDTTSFQLIGQHKTINCKLCHKTLKFAETNSYCMNCHSDIHSMSVGNECERCHTPASWLVNNIPEIHERVGFPLIGAHRTIFCAECHKSENLLRFDRIGNECVDCHLNNYNATQNPNHKVSGFSTDCISCHEPISNNWGNENFHFFFPLTGGHDLADCKQCHKSNNYSDISSDCYSCHKSDYDATQNPNHKLAAFSTDCLSCHENNTRRWNLQNFHTFFPLTGGHDIDDCKQCHKSNDYSNISAECISCHQGDFNSALSPNHSILNFSTQCLECHQGTNAWQPAQFKSHDSQYFPIYSGKHRGTWQTCANCHTNPSTYATNSCIICHSNESELAREHDDERDYRFADDACFRCHPRGEEDDD
ncbi:MAG: hypothetical protein PF517_16010 [Salinivirgaceae bacterium]|jgi:hypothetical protein|nr:hypothetical protein [Salinivirgaceae bacterium]